MKNEKIIEDAMQYIALAKKVQNILTDPDTKVISTVEGYDFFVTSYEIPQELQDLLQAKLGNMFRNYGSDIKICRIDKCTYSKEPNNTEIVIMDKRHDVSLFGYVPYLFIVNTNKLEIDNGQKADKLSRVKVGDSKSIHFEPGVYEIELNNDESIKKISYLPDEVVTRKEKTTSMYPPLNTHIHNIQCIDFSRNNENKENTILKQLSKFGNALQNILPRQQKNFEK